MMRLIKTAVYICLFLHSRAINSFSLIYTSSFRSYVGQASGIGSRSRSFVSKVGSLQVPESEKQGATRNNFGVAGKSSSVQVKIQQISNIASMLCVLDCTILPLVSVLLPLLGFSTATIGSTSADSLLHSIGHAISLYLVVPGKSSKHLSCTIIMHLLVNPFNTHGVFHFLSSWNFNSSRKSCHIIQSENKWSKKNQSYCLVRSIHIVLFGTTPCLHCQFSWNPTTNHETLIPSSISQLFA